MGEPQSMQQSTATRRLVKSPPELWAEISDEASLSRHLARFGDIRITRVSAETTVAWEGDRVSGTVQLGQAGLGTKVVLTATPTARASPPAAMSPADTVAVLTDVLDVLGHTQPATRD